MQYSFAQLCGYESIVMRVELSDNVDGLPIGWMGMAMMMRCNFRRVVIVTVT